MIRQRLVNAKPFITSGKEKGMDDTYSESNPELGFRRFLSSFVSLVRTHIDYEQSEIGSCDFDEQES